MTSDLKIDTLDDVDALDFRGPYDELIELREVLSTGEIAELTGLRRETISRARPDQRFQRRTEKALGDLYLVVTRLRAVRGEGNAGRVGAILRRPQPALGGRPISDLLREGQVDLVLEHLARPDPVASLLAADPELESRLPAIEAAVLEHFGPGASVERKIIEPWDIEDGEDALYLRVRNDLSFDENVDRLAQLLRQEKELLAPVRLRLTIGFLG